MGRRSWRPSSVLWLNTNQAFHQHHHITLSKPYSPQPLLPMSALVLPHPGRSQNLTARWLLMKARNMSYARVLMRRRAMVTHRLTSLVLAGGPCLMSLCSSSCFQALHFIMAWRRKDDGEYLNLTGIFYQP